MPRFCVQSRSHVHCVCISNVFIILFGLHQVVCDDAHIKFRSVVVGWIVSELLTYLQIYIEHGEWNGTIHTKKLEIIIKLFITPKKSRFLDIWRMFEGVFDDDPHLIFVEIMHMSDGWIVCWLYWFNDEHIIVNVSIKIIYTFIIWIGEQASKWSAHHCVFVYTIVWRSYT